MAWFIITPFSYKSAGFLIKVLSILFLSCFFASVTACTTLKLAKPSLTQEERLKIEKENEESRREWIKLAERQNAELEKRNKESQEAERTRIEEAEKQRQLQLRRDEENRRAKDQAEQKARLQAQLKAEQRKEADRRLSLLSLNPTTYTFNGYTLNDREQTIFKTILIDDFYAYIDVRNSSKELVPIWQEISSHTVTVNADRLQRDYESNEVAGDKKYMGRPLLISGTVSSINRGIGKNYYLALEGGSNMFVKPQASMADGFEDYLANLNKGQMVRLVCQGNGMFMGSATVNKCEPCSFWIKRQENNILMAMRRELPKKLMFGMAYYVIKMASVLPQSSNCLGGNIDGCLIELSKIMAESHNEKNSKIAADKLKFDYDKMNLIFDDKKDWSWK